jgi:hypothetical protein
MDLEKEKEEEVHDRTLAAGDWTHPGSVRSFLAKARWLAESEVKDRTLVLALTGASGHFFK